MDKQKQIEDMVYIIERSCCETRSMHRCNNNCSACLAEDLYAEGYRKIHENAVVLMEEELDKKIEPFRLEIIALCKDLVQTRKETAEKFARGFINDILPKIMNGHSEKALQIAMAMTNYYNEITEGKV